MARLIHLNGPPGIGKSTVAARYAAEHPGVLNLDIDVLRTMIGGWEADFEGSGRLVRPAALAMLAAYLGQGHDVVLPQMLVRLEELERFEAAATGVGADFRELVLMDTRDNARARFHQRGHTDPSPSPWHDQVRAVVRAEGGDALLDQFHDALVELVSRRSDAVVIETAAGSVAEAYRRVVAELG